MIDGAYENSNHHKIYSNNRSTGGKYTYLHRRFKEQISRQITVKVAKRDQSNHLRRSNKRRSIYMCYLPLTPMPHAPAEQASGPGREHGSMSLILSCMPSTERNTPVRICGGPSPSRDAAGIMVVML
jgi:hypothetical protein